MIGSVLCVSVRSLIGAPACVCFSPTPQMPFGMAAAPDENPNVQDTLSAQGYPWCGCLWLLWDSLNFLGPLKYQSPSFKPILSVLKACFGFGVLAAFFLCLWDWGAVPAPTSQCWDLWAHMGTFDQETPHIFPCFTCSGKEKTSPENPCARLGRRVTMEKHSFAFKFCAAIGIFSPTFFPV